MQWIGRLTLDQRVVGSIPKPGTFVLQQDISFVLLLSTQVYKWVPGRMSHVYDYSINVRYFMAALAGMLPREWRKYME